MNTLDLSQFTGYSVCVCVCEDELNSVLYVLIPQNVDSCLCSESVINMHDLRPWHVNADLCTQSSPGSSSLIFMSIDDLFMRLY